MTVCVAAATVSQYSFRCDRSRSINPISRRFTSINSIGAFPTRSPSDGPQRIGYSQSAIAVAVPIDANLLSRRLNHVLDRKFNKVVRAFWRRMADGIAQNDGARSASNRRGVKPLDGFSVR